jgi:hypothetical protein
MFLAHERKERKTDAMKSAPKLPKNVAPFTIGGWPVDALSQGTIRLLRKIAQEDGWTMEEVMTAAMEEFVVTCKAEEKLETKVIQFATSYAPLRSTSA